MRWTNGMALTRVGNKGQLEHGKELCSSSSPTRCSRTTSGKNEKNREKKLRKCDALDLRSCTVIIHAGYMTEIKVLRRISQHNTKLKRDKRLQIIQTRDPRIRIHKSVQT